MKTVEPQLQTVNSTPIMKPNKGHLIPLFAVKLATKAEMKGFQMEFIVKNKPIAT